MTIGLYKQRRNEVEVVATIEREILSEGFIAHLAGMLRLEGRLWLITFIWRQNMGRKFNLSMNDRKTQREILRSYAQTSEEEDPLEGVWKIEVDGKLLQISEVRTYQYHEWDVTFWAIIDRLLEAGWNEGALSDLYFPDMRIHLFELNGHQGIEKTFETANEIKFIANERALTKLVEKKLTLEIGEQNRAISLEEGVEITIQRVYLRDFRKEFNARYQSAEFQAQFSAEEIHQMRQAFEENLSQICPIGLYCPIVEYETAAQYQVNFFEHNFLESVPKIQNRASSFGMIIKPEEKFGKNGLPLRAEMIPIGVPEGTQKIEAELFSYIKREASQTLNFI